MGINPIGYIPWTGKRTRHLYRLYVIAKSIFSEKIRSKAILILIFIGIIIVYALPLLDVIFLPHEVLTSEDMIGGANPVLGDPLILFSMLLAAIISSDIISRDLSDNSFVLYFSRPIRPIDYLIGKITGGFAVMAIFCLLPLIMYGVVIIATQSSSDYLKSLEVLGLASFAGILNSFFFIGFGTMLSSVTKNRGYAGVGTFVSFFVLSLISRMFTEIDVNWILVNPAVLLKYTYGMIFNIGLPEELSSDIYWTILLSILIVPIIFAYWRINKKATGK